MEETHTFHSTFNLVENGFQWMSCPENFSLTTDGLRINMDAEKNFWRVTYSKPHVIKEDGHVLYKTFPRDKNVMIETSFKLTAVNQLDQAGIILYTDSEHWVRAGLEYVEGRHKLSCVVTDNYSDWSTQDYTLGEQLDSKKRARKHRGKCSRYC